MGFFDSIGGLGGAISNVAGSFGYDTSAIDQATDVLAGIGGVVDTVSDYQNGYQMSGYSTSAANYGTALYGGSNTYSTLQNVKYDLASRALGFDASRLSDDQIMRLIGQNGAISGLTAQEATVLRNSLDATSGLTSNGAALTVGDTSPETTTAAADERLKAKLRANGWSEEEINDAYSTDDGRKQARMQARNMMIQSIMLFWQQASEEQKNQFSALQSINRNMA